MSRSIEHLPVLFQHLHRVGHDYLPHIKADGQTDDATIIESRVYHGLDPLAGDNSGRTIYLSRMVTLDYGVTVGPTRCKKQSS